MRVLLDVSAVPTKPAGAGVYTVALARGLAARDGVDLHLLTRRDDSARWPDLAPGAEVHALVPAVRPARLVWEQWQGPRLADRLRPDLWHGPHYTLPARLRVPAVATIHDLTFFDHPEWHERTKVVFFRAATKAAARRARMVICVSGHTADRLRARVDVRAEVAVAYHGVEERFRASGDETDDLARLAARGVSPPYVAFVGTVEPRKDVPALVSAFARVAAHRPELRLVLAGSDGWGVAAVRAAIAAGGVASRVVRTGYLPDDDVPALLRRAAAVAYPSRAEGFGLPALEALACGAPLVTTEGSAPAEVVGDAALLVPPGDTGALAGALDRMLDDPATAERLRAAGPLQAAPFTWERCVDAHLDAYRVAARLRAVR